MMENFGFIRKSRAQTVSRSRVDSASSGGGRKEANSPSLTRGSTPDSNNSDQENARLNKSPTKLKSFFKQLFKSGREDESNPTNNIRLKTFSTSVEESNEEIGNSLNRFLTLENEAVFEEYRKSSSFASNKYEFRELFGRAVESANFDSIGDFYYWYFSRSENIVELLISKREAEYNFTTDNKKLSDASYHVSMNWRFLREIYNCFAKLVIYY